MLQAKLFVLNKEIDLLKTDMSYSRCVNGETGESSKVVGGKISLTFEALEEAHDLMNWITRASGGSDLAEKSKMEEGKVCFYENGFENAPSKTYEFNDAYLIHYREYFNRSMGIPMLTTLVISPAIQNYGAENIEAWNVSYIAPTEQMPHQPMEEVTEELPKIYDLYFEDLDGNRIKELIVGAEVYIVVASENCSGKVVNINLSDKDHDFLYEDEILEGDILKDITLNGDTHKEKLRVVADHSDTNDGSEAGSEGSPQSETPSSPALDKTLTDYYLTDKDGKKVEEYEVGDMITLNIKTKNRIGDTLTIHLEDQTHDFKYNGEVIKEKLTGITISKDEEKIELEVIVQASKS